MLPNVKSVPSTTFATEAEIVLPGFLEGDGKSLKDGELQSRKIQEEIFLPRIHWINFFLAVYIFVYSPYGFYILFAQAKPLSFFWCEYWRKKFLLKKIQGFMNVYKNLGTKTYIPMYIFT